jgi:hypothetical protein
MPAHELVGDALQGIGDGEVAGFRLELRQKHRLEQEVAELFAEPGVVVSIDGLEDLIGLLEDERFQGINRLHAIPGTPLGRTQRGHDLDEARELLHV